MGNINEVSINPSLRAFAVFSGTENTEITGETILITFPIGGSRNIVREGATTFVIPVLKNNTLQIILRLPIIVTDPGPDAIVKIISNKGVILERNINSQQNNCTVIIDEVFSGINTISVSIEVSTLANITLERNRSISLMQLTI